MADASGVINADDKRLQRNYAIVAQMCRLYRDTPAGRTIIHKLRKTGFIDDSDETVTIMQYIGGGDEPIDDAELAHRMVGVARAMKRYHTTHFTQDDVQCAVLNRKQAVQMCALGDRPVPSRSGMICGSWIRTTGLAVYMPIGF